MKIEEYIRIKIADKVRPLLIKNECDICKDAENLELHHVKPFAILLKECHKSLNIEYKKDKSDYTDMEIKNITNWMLGMHLNIRCLTLCEKCHENIHIKNGGYKNCGNYINKAKKEELEKLYIKNELIPYLNSITDKRLFKEDQQELINKMNVKGSDGRSKKSTIFLNKYLEQNNLNFIIYTKMTSKTINNKKKNLRYWIINRN